MIHHNHEGQVIGFFLVVGGGLITHTLANCRKLQWIKTIPTSLASSAAQGTDEFQGYGWPIKPVSHPVTGKQCLFYEMKIQERRRSGNNTTWVDIYTERSHNPFAVIDHSGYVTIIPELADLEIQQSTFPESTFTLEQKNRLKLACQKFSWHGTWRAEVKALGVGAPIYVLGTFDTHFVNEGPMGHAPLPGIEKFWAAVQTFGKNPVFDLQRMDRNHDGRVDESERAAFFASVAEQAMQGAAFAAGSSATLAKVSGDTFSGPSPAAATGPYAVSHGFVRAETSRPFIMADCHRAELIKRLNKWLWTKLILGSALVATGITLVALHFHSLGVF